MGWGDDEDEDAESSEEASGIVVVFCTVLITISLLIMAATGVMTDERSPGKRIEMAVR